MTDTALRDLDPGFRVLIVGGAGFIGHHLALRLKALGATPVVLDDFSVNHINAPIELDRPGVNSALYRLIAQERLDALNANGIEIRERSARDIDALTDTLRELSPAAVVELAAISHASRSNAHPHRAFENGMETLEATLEAMRRVPGAHLVYASSSMVYGDFATDTVDEDAPCDPLGIYGALKLGGEVLIRAQSRVNGMEHTIVRPAAAYGPRCIGRRFIQASIENAIAGHPLQIMGDGTEKVDFTYVHDLVDGLVRVLTVPAARNRTFNITAGSATSLLDVASLVQERFPGTPIEHLERSASVPRRGSLDITRATELLGYRPAHTIAEGVNATIDWYLGLTTRHPGLLSAPAPIVNE